MYLSHLIGKTIVNKSGVKIGKMVDAVATRINTPLPLVSGIIATRGFSGKPFFISKGDIARLEDRDIKLSTDTIDFTPYDRRDMEIRLEKEVFDKQIIDVKERHLARINDVELTIQNKNIFITGVDVSFRSILARLKIPTWGFFFKYNTIPWEEIQFLGTDLPVKVKIDYERLETLHPADIARFIFQGPGYRKGTQIIQSLEENIAADVMESLPLDVQINILENMSSKAAGRIISEMESHWGADVLSEFPTKKAEEILNKTDNDKALIIKQLLTYAPDTAGAIMKVEYVSVEQNITVSEFYDRLRSYENLPEFLTYFYITESANSKKLVGIVSLWELFKASHRNRINTVMIKNAIIAKPQESARRVLKRMTQYDFSAIPVVNKHKHIIGIVTLNDAIRLLIPKDWKTRIGLK
ncbi:magnesium transporter [Candidatus Gottesmanbacteria bacterium]|nr:magnesium transporter [Candidatus Gottesmanbacteria bacterium]